MLDKIIAHIKSDWKTTIVGLAQLSNGILSSVQAYQLATASLYNEQELRDVTLLVAKFFAINGILQAVKGIVGKDSGKGSDRPQEITDAKLDRIPPNDGVQP